MKLLSASQIHEADQYTILNEPISSVDLMERASAACTDWLLENFDQTTVIGILCGMGNNGGDGWVIARLLKTAGYDVRPYAIMHGQAFSPDCDQQLRKWEENWGPTTQIATLEDLPELETFDVVIDAILGTGLSAPLRGLLAGIVMQINDSQKPVVAIDLPTGLFCDYNDHNNLGCVVKAGHTLTFQFPKLAFFLPDSGPLVGDWKVLDIGLHPDFIQQVKVEFQFFTETHAIQITKPRLRFSHKGTHGHVAIVGGELGKVGAVVLAGQGALRSGAGLCTLVVGQAAVPIVQSSFPEAMTEVNTIPESTNALAIGPGLGLGEYSEKLLDTCLAWTGGNLVVDADALNLLARRSNWKVPTNTILTPHPGEFDRLFGTKSHSWREKIQMAKAFVQSESVILVLKNAYTMVFLPDGQVWINSSGNAALAKGGSGDVLTGVIVSLLAQGYAPQDAARLGVWLHGRAGEYAAKLYGTRGVLSSDVANTMGLVWPQ
jgi:hydroxyethylthiazole kinase-like uncharacterized protein yjeF